MKLSFVDCNLNYPLQEWVMMRNNYMNCPVYNFYSLVAYGMPLNGLVPIKPVMDLLTTFYTEEFDSAKFDYSYGMQLLHNPSSWIDLMQIVGSFQYAPEVIVLTNYSQDPFIYIVDAFIKFLKLRYSFDSYIIKDMIDIDPYDVSDFESQEGYMNLINDIDLFKKMYSTPQQVQNEVYDVI